MPLPTSLIGTSFNATQVSLGSISDPGGSVPITYTESKLLSNQTVLGTPIGPGALATVTALTVPDASGNQTIAVAISNSPAPFANGQTISGSVLGNDVTDFLLTGSLSGSTGFFYVTNTPAQQPGVGGAALVAKPISAVAYTPACYCAGTLIRTEDGDRPVEQLEIGDRVVTHAGKLEPIRWIGRRSYHGRFLAGHTDLLPIRISAGALGDGLPTRDLLVSPKHAMFIDGLLIEAELLLNGSTIRREEGMARVDYFHLELAQHDLVWAEGAPSETFIDDDSRGVFHNAASYEALYPAAAMAAPRYCAPRITDGPALEAIRRRLVPRRAA